MAHTNERTKRITVTLPEALVREVGSWSDEGEKGNRSRLIQNALRLYLRHLKTRHLGVEAAKLSKEEMALEEMALAEEDIVAVNETRPDY